MARQVKKRGDGAPLRVAEEGVFDAGAAPAEGMMALREAFPMELLGPATGTRDRDLAVRLVLDLARGLGQETVDGAAGDGDNGDGEDGEDGGAAAARRLAAARNRQWALLAGLAAMREIGPRDGMEGMLAVQMVTVHGASIELARRALAPGRGARAGALDMHHTARLMWLFTRQMEVLERRHGRGDAPARLNVGRVNVEAGGQAIVGTVNGGRRDEAGTEGDGA